MHIVDRDLQFMCAIIFVEVRCQMAATSTFISCHCFLFVLVISRSEEQSNLETMHAGFMSHVFFAFGVCVVKNVHGDALFVQASIRARAQDMMVIVTFLFFLLVNSKNDKHNHFLGLGLGPKLLFCLTNEILRKLVHIAHIMLCQIIVPIAHAILSVVSRKNSIIVLPW